MEILCYTFLPLSFYLIFCSTFLPLSFYLRTISCFCIHVPVHASSLFPFFRFVSSRIKKGEDRGKEKCHTKNYDEQLSQWKSKIYTQHVPLRQNVEEKERGKELKAVWDDENEWSTKSVWKTEKKGPKVLKSTYPIFVYYESIKREQSVVYYESIKRELNKRLIFDSGCDARLKAKTEGCTRLAYTMWL